MTQVTPVPAAAAKNPFADILGKNKVAAPPSEGGSFQPTGFVGPVQLSIVRRVSVPDTFVQTLDTQRQADPFPVSEYGWVASQKRGANTNYYFPDENPALAEKLARLVQPDKKGGAWREILVSMLRDAILNWSSPEASKNWSPIILMAVSYDGWASTARDKAMLHLLFMPALVHAAALLSGYLAEPIWSATEVFGSELRMTKEDRTRLFGFDKIQESELFQRRARLWAALGEDNPVLHTPIGSGTKYDVTSEKLSQMLQLVYTNWMAPLYTRTALGWNPNPLAAYGDSDPETGEKGVKVVDGEIKHTQHPQIPIILEFYADEAAAQKAADADKARFAKKDTGVGTGVPAFYAKAAQEWPAALEALLSMLPKVPPMALLVGAQAGQYTATAKMFSVEQDELVAALRVHFNLA